MKQSVNIHTFRDAFQGSQYQNNFSYEGLEVLFDSLESLEDDTGEEMELDIVAICCDFSEDDANSIMSYYNISIEDYEELDEEELTEAVIEYLHDQTFVSGSTDSGSIIYQSF